jgi:hypothetical protein
VYASASATKASSTRNLVSSTASKPVPKQPAGNSTSEVVAR